MKLKSILTAAAFSVTGVVLSCVVSASEFPTGVVRIVVPFAPGGSAELQARTLGEQLSKDWGQPVIIENRPGAGTTIGAASVASAPADGYTLYLAGTSHTISPSLYPSITYDPVESFAAISQVSISPFFVVVNPDLDVDSIEGLIEMAKNTPDGLSFGTSGVGAGPHLAAELLSQAVDIDTLHIPFVGTAPAMVAVMGQHVDFGMGDVAALPLIRDGELKALAVTTIERTPSAPDVPTLDETVAAGLEVTNWSSILAPAGTPPEVIAFINKSIAEALAIPEVQDAYAALGFQVAPNNSEEMQAKLASEVAKYSQAILDAGISAD